MTETAPVCWVVSDGRRGIENQALGLAQAVSSIRPLDIRNYKISNGAAFSALPPLMQFKLRASPKLYNLPAVTPDLSPDYVPKYVIGCGRQSIAPLLAIKAQNPQVFTAYIQDPRIDCRKFDLVIAPEHDGLTGDNVEVMIGSPNLITHDKIVTETIKFADVLSHLPMPRAAFLIGGPSSAHKMSKSDHAAHMKSVKAAIGACYSVMITPSRRTPSWVIDDYKQLASDNESVWLYDGKGGNPYFAFLGGAEVILITEDSTNMLTEACSTGKSVFRLPMSGDAGKFQALYSRLAERCNLAAFEGRFQAPAYTALDETRRIAQQFLAHIEAKSAVHN